MGLSDTRLRGLKADAERDYTVLDGDGLYLEVKRTGKKFWRYRKQHNGVNYRRSLGEYPAIGLSEARELRNEAKRKIILGIIDDEGINTTFRSVALEWVAQTESMSKGMERGKYVNRGRLETYILPAIGDMGLDDVRPSHIRDLIGELNDRGTRETAYRCLLIVKKVFDYAYNTDRTENDPTSRLMKVISPARPTHMASLRTPEDVGRLMRAIETYRSAPVRAAIKLQAFTFVRPYELRNAEWEEFDLSCSTWRIPAAKMKMREHHIVPLSTQAVAVMEELKPYTGHGRYCFPGAQSPAGDKPMSESTVLRAIRNLGFTKDEMTGHGFRSMASTLLNENGWNRDAIERQLAHNDRNKVRAAYNFADFMSTRKAMMQWWGDYLESLRDKTCKPEIPKI